MNATKDETTRLVLPSKVKEIGNIGIDECDDKQQQQQQQRVWVNIWKTIALISMGLLVAVVIMIDPGNVRSPMHLKLQNSPKCMFCDQSPPKLHFDKSYSIKGFGVDPNGEINNDDIIVTPMTITYNYELYNGQNIFTNEKTELIPNLDFDYAVLGVTTTRNINRETNEPVSLDEVYMHHLTISPMTMIGAESLTRNNTTMPLIRFPDGYALHVRVEENPSMKINAHLLSNKDLAPIDGSLPRAHKECNECYYAPGKGSDCTPEVSGTFKCCADSFACKAGGEQCACATNGETDISQTTKYQIQVDLLISRDIEKFKLVDQWQLTAPACVAVYEDYATDNFCFNDTISLEAGGGSLFHQIPENDVHPYVKTKINVLAPAGGNILWAQSHVHTGGINATLLLNGDVICSTSTVYGTDSNEITNARNEQNHLIRIEPCYTEIGETGIRFDTGDVITAESFYYGGTQDERFVGIGAAGEHKNVMSMFFMGVIFDGDTDYLTKKRTSFSYWNNFVPISGY